LTALPTNELHKALMVTLSHMKKWNNPKHNNALDMPIKPHNNAQAVNITE
jgi:hypothetical protein